jgi:hypothetical protein
VHPFTNYLMKAILALFATTLFGFGVAHGQSYGTPGTPSYIGSYVYSTSAAVARSAPRWSAFPNGETSTHCASAAAGALQAGGVVGIPSSGSVWPREALIN